MKNITSALCWALAMALFALGARTGVIARDSAETMILVTAMLAAIQIALGKRTHCTIFARKEETR